VASTSTNEGDTTGVTLRDAKDLTAPGTPLKDQIFIASTNIESYTSGPADAKPANGDSELFVQGLASTIDLTHKLLAIPAFKTDIDISQKKPNAGRERELQAWLPDHDVPSLATDDTFGTTVNTGWDQFAVNEQLFGVTGGFNEDEYTTKLDRSAADFKERELKAQRIAAEILGVCGYSYHCYLFFVTYS
jgi:PAB1-binding protein PBP1